jgi:hypothetical protein
LYFLTVGNPYRNGRRERISSSEAMMDASVDIVEIMFDGEEDNVPRPYITVSKLLVGTFREGIQPQP